MSEVFGVARHPAYFVRRRDALGEPISIIDELPESKAILFTGPPGMGKTSELDRAEDLAVSRGWTAIRLQGSATSPIEHQLTRAVTEKLEELRERFGRRPVKHLSQTVGDLTRSGRNRRVGWEARALGSPLPVELVLKEDKDITAHDDLGATLPDLADELGRLTEIDGKPILLLIDNVDKATENDRAGLNELAIHIEEEGRPVSLVCAGGATSTADMMIASRRMSGIATLLTNQFDIRQLGALSDEELWPALTEPLDRAGIPYEYEAIDKLLEAANGDPSWLRTLGDAAVELSHPGDGITVRVAERATTYVRGLAAEYYEGRWNQEETTDAQKDLLATVAAQGPNGLFMPDHTVTADEGVWQQIDEARQSLVARGLLREQNEVVTIPDVGFRDWLNDYTGQLPAPPEPDAPSGRARRETALAPAHLTSRALVNQVFGTAGALVHQIDRKDKNGEAISLDQRPPKGTCVLFTGPAGMGTSHELGRVQALADRQGWIALSVNASKRESVAAKLVREVRSKFGEIKEHLTPAEARELQDILRKMAVQTKNTMKTGQIRLGLSPIGKVGFHTAWEGMKKDSVGTTLNQFAEHLGKLAQHKQQPIVLMVDNLDAASWPDRVILTEVAAQLQRQSKPLFLIAAGGEETIPRLLDASGGDAGKETAEVLGFQLRKLQALTDQELRPAVTEPLRQAGIPAETPAIDDLVAASNGNPTRMRILVSAALEITDSRTGITAEVATVAKARLNTQSRALYDAVWLKSNPMAKELLRKAASHPHGMPRPAQSEPASSTKRWSLDSEAQNLISRGLLARSDDNQIRIADPGFRDWVHTRFSATAANAGVALPTAKPPQLSAGERPTSHRATPTHAHPTRTAGR